MEIEYKNKRIEKICTDAAAARAKYGEQMAAKIHMRVDNLRAATNVEMLLSSRIGRCHMLRHDRQGQYAMDLLNGMRLSFVFAIALESLKAIASRCPDYLF